MGESCLEDHPQISDRLVFLSEWIFFIRYDMIKVKTSDSNDTFRGQLIFTQVTSLSHTALILKCYALASADVVGRPYSGQMTGIP